MTCGQVWCPILGICALHVTYPCAHTQQWIVKHTHTHTHTHREQLAVRVFPRAQLGVRCLAQGSHLTRGIKGGRERWAFTPPTDNPCQTWESNLQSLGNKSDSLTMRPLLHKNFLKFLQVNTLVITMQALVIDVYTSMDTKKPTRSLVK